MTPEELHALRNYYKPLRTPDAKLRDALLHVQQSTKEKAAQKDGQQDISADDTTGVSSADATDYGESRCVSRL